MSAAVPGAGGGARGEIPLARSPYKRELSPARSGSSGMERSGSSGSGTGNCTGNSTGSGSRDTGRSSGRSSGNDIGNDTGNSSGNGTGSGRAAPPGGAGRALLLLALLLLSPARALPTPVRPLPTPVQPLPTPAESLSRSRDLLEAANASLHRLKELGTLGFECTLEEVDLEDITENQINTIKACTAEDPGPGNCPVLEIPTFDKGKCLQGISEDLRTYRAQLRKLQDPQLLGALDGMMEALGSSSGKVPGLGSFGSLGSSGSGSLGSGLGSGSLGSAPFPERLRLCGALLALRVRSVTISRMLSFLSSL